MQKSNTLVVMDYSGLMIMIYTIPAELTSEQVEDWITGRTFHKLKDIHFMVGKDIHVMDNRNEQVETEEQETYSPQEGEKFARKCDVTGEGMDEGYVVDELTYIKYKKDLIEHLRKLDWPTTVNWNGTGGTNPKDIKDEQELMEFFHNEDYYYWTTWDGISDFEYIFTNGQLVEIELIESLKEQETKQSNATAWDFVEKYYPNYSSSDQICRALDLLLKKETEELSSEEDIEITYILEDVYEQAIANFIKINGGI